MKVPVGASEDDLVNLIVYGISQVIKKEGHPTSFDSETRIAKVAFDVAESLELPVTRSWYKFGTFVWSHYANTGRLDEFLGLSPEFTPPDPQILIKKASTTWRPLYKQIEEQIAGHDLLWKTSLSDFLMRLYQNEAPKKFRKLYVANRTMTSRFDKLAHYESTEVFPIPALILASQEVTRLHKELRVFTEEPRLIHLMADFTTFLEDLIVQHDEIMDDSAALTKWRSFFASAYDFYSQEIWDFPASVIAKETVKGPRDEEIKSQRERRLVQLPSYETELSHWLDKAFESKTYPTLAQVQSAQDKLARLVGSDEKAIKEVFTRLLLPKWSAEG